MGALPPRSYLLPQIFCCVFTLGLTCALVLMPLSGVCPVSFFGMLRKGHLLSRSPGALDSFQQRVRTDFQSPSSLGVLGYYLLE